MGTTDKEEYSYNHLKLLNKIDAPLATILQSNDGMSQINHRKPSFAPLNTRKTDQTVGQTYGERREKVKTADAEQSLNWVQRAKDKFLRLTPEGKKENKLEVFGNSTDRFLTPSDSIRNKNRRIENGTDHSKTAKPAGDQYVTFLDSIITYLDQKPKKV